MALILADRVLETSTSEGLGTFALAGAQTGYQTFSSGIGNGNTCYYTINGQTTEQWEVGIGTVGASTLARTTLISSNTGSFINFVAGVKNVFVTQPASKSIYKDENGNAIPLGSASATQLDITAQGDLRLQDTTGGQYVALQAPSTIATSYTLTMPADDGTAGQALVTDGSGVLSWSSAASGDVYGPASATDNAVARYDGTTGKIIQNSAVTIGDDGATVIDVNSTSAGLRITQIGTGNALLVEDAANPDATPFVIDNSGNAIQGNTTFNTIGSLSIGGFQAQQNSSGAVGTSVISYGTAAAAYARAAFARSPSGVIGTNAAVAINNALMELVAYGHDGTAFIPAASIQANVDGTPGTNDMPGRLVFSTTADGASSPTERMRIDSAGNVGVGTTAQAFEKLVLAGTFPSGSANTRANVVRGTIPSSTTSLFNGFRTEPTTQAASFTLAAMTHFSANQGTLGAGSAVTNQYGFIAESNLTGATNNYGFLGNIPSGTGRFNFYAAGTADNYFAGKVGIGMVPSNQLDVSATTYCAVGVTSGTVQGQIAANAGGSVDVRAVSNHALILYSNNTERMRITNAGTISLGAAPGSESLRVTPVASAVNYVEALGALTAQPPTLRASGSDTNIPLWISSKGTSTLNFYTNSFSTLQFSITNAASAVNYLQVTGAATGNTPNLSAQGSDAAVNISYSTKGTGFHNFTTGGGTQFLITNTASAVNYLQVTGGDGTTTSPRFSAQGSSTDVTVQFQSKGAGELQFFTNSVTRQFNIAHTASAVNYLQVTGSATGNAATLSAQGSDTNIDLALTPKGTGKVRFGTHTGTADVAVTGYIEVKDSAGNVRKLAVIT